MPATPYAANSLGALGALWPGERLFECTRWSELPFKENVKTCVASDALCSRICSEVVGEILSY